MCNKKLTQRKRMKKENKDEEIEIKAIKLRAIMYLNKKSKKHKTEKDVQISKPETIMKSFDIIIQELQEQHKKQLLELKDKITAILNDCEQDTGSDIWMAFSRLREELIENE